jgi:hypothetical protein
VIAEGSLGDLEQLKQSPGFTKEDKEYLRVGGYFTDGRKITWEYPHHNGWRPNGLCRGDGNRGRIDSEAPRSIEAGLDLMT